jgi:hypothetical protein
MVRFLNLVAATMLVTTLASDLCTAQEGPGGGRPRGGRGGRPSFDMLLGAFDSDDSEDLSEDEVPGRVWYRLSQADADDNGLVNRQEFEAFGKPRGI